MISRRRFLGSAAATGVLGVGAPPLLRAQSDWSQVVERGRAQGQVTFYSSGIARIEEPRMAAYGRANGVRVNYSRPGGGEIVIRKFAQELKGAVAGADVCTLTDYALGLYAKKQGWAAAVDLPNFAQLGKAFEVRDPGIVPNGGFGLIIVVNEKMLPPGSGPTRYADLVDPQYKGKILFGAPENAGSTTLMIKGFVEQHGWEFVKKLRANDVAEMRLQAEAMQAVARGEKPICVVAHVWGHLYKKQGAPVRLVFPEDGTVLAQTCLFVSARAPHPDAARVLANYLISKEYQAGVVESGAYPSNREAPLAAGVPPLDSIKLYNPNLVELEATRGEVIDQWRRIMG